MGTKHNNERNRAIKNVINIHLNYTNITKTVINYNLKEKHLVKEVGPNSNGRSVG